MKQLFFALFFSLILAACSSSEKLDKSTPEGAYRAGERLEKAERYDEAIAQFAEVRNQHPYSKFATDAELKIADIHFRRESFVEAQSAYEVFKEMHPKHERIAYVTYQLASSYFQQLPSTIDRDLTLADKAILYFDEVINSYPTSEYVSKAKEEKRKALRMLAEKELYVANFYFTREKYDSALGRFEEMLRAYPNTGLDAEALSGAAISALKVKDNTKAKLFFDKLVSLFPNSESAARARKEFNDAK